MADIKLVIKIPEEDYNFVKKQVADGITNPLKMRISNGTPLSEKLEAIKAEFEEIKLPRDNPYNNKTEYSVSMKELRELFDKHIAELKGEQK